MTEPILQYDFITDPFPLQASPKKGTLEKADLTLLVSNPTDEPVSLSGIIVVIPVGENATNLVPDSEKEKITVNSPAGCKLDKTDYPAGQIKFIFLPEKNQKAISIKFDGLKFIFQGLSLNRESGRVKIKITEGSNQCKPPNCPSQDLYVTKFPSGWGEVNFYAEPAFITDSSQGVRLHWNGPPSGSYSIEYIDKHQIKKIPPTGAPSLESKGVYPSLQDSPLKLNKTTSFMLTARANISGKEHVTEKNLIVLIDDHYLHIDSFGPVEDFVSKGEKYTLSWETRNATRGVIKDDLGSIICRIPAEKLSKGQDDKHRISSAPVDTTYNKKFELVIYNQKEEKISRFTTLQVLGDLHKVAAIPRKTEFSYPAILSPDERLLYVTDLASGSISRFNTHTRKKIDEINVEGQPRSCAISRDGELLYVFGQRGFGSHATNTSGYVATINLKTKEKVNEIRVPRPFQCSMLSPNSCYLYLCHYDGTIEIFDIKMNKKIKTVKAEPNLVTAKIGPDENIMYILNGPNTLSIFDITLKKTTGTIELSKISESHFYFSTMFMDVNEKILYITNYLEGKLYLIDVEKKKIFNHQEEIGKNPTGLVISSDRKLYISHLLSDSISIFSH